MNDDPHVFPFPPMSDEAVVAVNDFLEELCRRFQNHYFHQIRRYYATRPDPRPAATSLSDGKLDDPPF